MFYVLKLIPVFQKTYLNIGPNALVNTKIKCNNYIIKKLLMGCIMKLLSSQIKKLFCFTLSISLLFSNVNIFAQDMNLPPTRQLVKDEIWPRLMELQPALVETQTSFEELFTAVQTGEVAQYQKLISKYQENLKNASHIYSSYKGKYNAYDAFLTSEEFTPEVARLARQYGKPGEGLPEFFILEKDVLFGKINSEIEWLKGQSNEEIARRIIGLDSDLPYLQEVLSNRFHYEDMINYNKIDMKAYNLDSKSAKYIREHLTPEDVLGYAYQSLNYKSKESKAVKAAVDLDLKLHYKPQDMHTFIKGIREYYRKFRHMQAPGYIKLMRSVRAMSFAERENYLLNVVAPNLEKGDRKLITDIVKSHPTQTPFIKKLLSEGPMIIIGSALIVFTITSIASANNFTPVSMSPGKFAEIKQAIDANDPNLTLKDITAFYDSPLAEQVISKDLDHAILFSNIVLSAKHIEESMEEKQKVDEQKTEEYTLEQIKVALPQNDTSSYEKDYGVGNLPAGN